MDRRSFLTAGAGTGVAMAAAAFEAACDAADYARAAQLQEAEYLSGFSLPGCSEFDDWVYFRREALRSRLCSSEPISRGMIAWKRCTANCGSRK